MNIPRIYHVYTSNDIPCISLDILCIHLLEIHGIFKDIPCISTPMDIHGISMYIPRIYNVYVGGLHKHGIYHITIYQAYHDTEKKYGLQISA